MQQQNAMTLGDPENGGAIHLTRDSTCEHVMWLTLDHPAARNAWSDKMFDYFEDALDHCEDDISVRCVIITGAGPAFSAGGNVKSMRSSSGDDEAKKQAAKPQRPIVGPVGVRKSYLRGIQRIPRRLDRFEKPVVAAVNGAAIGAGLDLAMMCDIRVISRKAKLGSTFVKLGLSPGDGGAYLMQRIVGFAKALELQLTGRIFDAEYAEKIGLANLVVDDGELRAAASKMATELATSGAPLAVQLCKRSIYRSRDMTLEHALELVATLQGVLTKHPDHAEGVHALLEKRPANFSGLEGLPKAGSKCRL